MNSGRIAIVLGLAVISLPMLPGRAMAQDRGWYVGGSWGERDFDLGVGDFDDGSITSGSVDTTDTAWKLFGGFRFDRYLSVEAGYVDLDNDVDGRDVFQGVSDGTGSIYTSLPAGAVSVNVQPTGMFVEGVGALPLGRGFSLFGKLGLLRWDADITVTDLDGARSADEDGTDLVYGLGFDYRFRSGIALRLEWQRFADVPDNDLDLVSAGISYQF